VKERSDAPIMIFASFLTGTHRFTWPTVFLFEKLPVCLALFPALAVWHAAAYEFLSLRRQGEGLAFIIVLSAKTGGGGADCK